MARSNTEKTFTNLFNKARSKSKVVSGISFDPKSYPEDKSFKSALKALNTQIVKALSTAGVAPDKVEPEGSDLLKIIRDIKIDPEFFDCKSPLSSGDITFDDIAGLEDVKEQLQVNYIWPFSYPLLFPAIAKGILFYGPPGTGKCLSPEEGVIMFDGTIKKAKDVKVGDQLMGDDSTPRNVLNISSGQDEMFKISPKGSGLPFVVNRPHVLSLINLNPPKKDVVKNQWTVSWLHLGKLLTKTVDDEEDADQFIEYISYLRNPGGPPEAVQDVIDIPLDSYLASTDLLKSCYQGYRTSIERPFEPVPIHPYVLGVFLGSEGSLALDRNTESALVQTGTDKASFIEAWRSLDLTKKRIPSCYKNNHRSIRLWILAGLINTHGYSSDGRVEIIINKDSEDGPQNVSLIDDILFLARSVGLTAHAEECTKIVSTSSKPWSDVVKTPHLKPVLEQRTSKRCYHINISGEGIEEIPIHDRSFDDALVSTSSKRSGFPLVENLKLASQKQVTVPFDFDVTPLGVGDYCGFTLDGNSRFLLKDFTVTHNTMLARAATDEIEGAAFFAPSPGELKGKYEGETEKNIDQVFRCAQQIIEDPNSGYKFSIVFFDEFDSIGGKRGDDPSMTRSVNALLQAMDGIKQRKNVSVIAATNYPSSLDEAILRRFTTRIFVDLPDAMAREYLIREALAVAYGDPNLTSSQKRKLIRDPQGDFITNSRYITNIKELGGFIGKGPAGWFGGAKVEDKYIDDTYVDLLISRFGPSPIGTAIIAEVKASKEVNEDDSRLNTPSHVFGYSPSDITKIMEMAIKFASTRALYGKAKKITRWGAQYYLVSIADEAGSVPVFDLEGTDAASVVNFDIRQSDVERALKSLSSTVDNHKYLELLKYSKLA